MYVLTYLGTCLYEYSRNRTMLEEVMVIKINLSFSTMVLLLNIKMCSISVVILDARNIFLSKRYKK
jgi:hypothetical protein